MEFDELLVTTKVDALVRLVKEKGTIELGIAAKLLDVEPENVEEWAHILEEEGLVKIDYKLTKAYLGWVTPSAEEVEKEKESFYTEKGELLQEVRALKQQMEPKEQELEGLKADFREIYDKLMPNIEKLQAQISSISSVKGKGGEKLGSYFGRLDLLQQQCKELSTSFTDLKTELAEMKKSLKEKATAEPKFKEVDGIKKGLSELGDRLKSVDEKIAIVQKSIPKEKLDKETLQKSLEPLKRDFADFKRFNSTMRENLLSIKEAFEIVGSIDASLGERAARLAGMKKEAQALLSSMKELQDKGAGLAEDIKSEIGAIDGFSDSMEFVKAAFSKFPSQKEVLERMDELNGMEKSLESKISSLEKTLSPSAIPRISLDELAKLKAELDERRKLLSREVSELFSAVEDESATYSTFQKIKERALASIEEYTSGIQKMEAEVKSIAGETRRLQADIDGELEKMKGKVDDKALQQLLSAAEQVEQKKALLDDVAESLEALTAASDGISKKLNLLSKEAELLSLRSGGAPSASEARGREEKETEVRQQLSLTKTEQADFDRKREELRELIKKLWEQS